MPPQPLFGRLFDFTTFFTLAILNRAAHFFSQAVFEYIHKELYMGGSK